MPMALPTKVKPATRVRDEFDEFDFDDEPA
jgi:hypothetical protein